MLFDIPDGHSSKQTVGQQQPMKAEQLNTSEVLGYIDVYDVTGL